MHARRAAVLAVVLTVGTLGAPASIGASLTKAPGPPAADTLAGAAQRPGFVQHEAVLADLADAVEDPSPAELLAIGSTYLDATETSPPELSVEDPATEIRRLYAALGQTPTEATERQLAELDRLPEPAREALAELARAQRYAHAVAASAPAEVPAEVDDPDQVPWTPLVTAARAQLAAATAAARTLEALGPQPIQLDDCGAVAIDLTETSNHHACDVYLSVDAGGDDRYTNNAGGSGPSAGSAGLALDLGGDDTYAPVVHGGGHVGGAYRGLGLLYDATGDDDYTPRTPEGRIPTHVGLNGGGSVASVAVLADEGGDDVYHVRGTVEHAAVNGGSNLGLSVLHDEEGNDVHLARAIGSVGATGGTERAAALMYDGGGQDRRHTNASSWGVEGGVHGGASSGLGVLIDAGTARDVYWAEGWDPIGQNGMVAVNGGAIGTPGLGVLVDQGGPDRYHGAGFMGCGINGGAITGGAGLLADGGGDDVLEARCGKVAGLNGAGAQGGAGLLVAEGGDDRYDACIPFQRTGAANGGGALGTGALVDRGGTDVYATEITDALVCGEPDLEVDRSRVPSGAGARLDLPS